MLVTLYPNNFTLNNVAAAYFEAVSYTHLDVYKRQVLIFAINPWMSLFFMVYFQIAQQFENNLIYPRVVGNSVGLPGLSLIHILMMSPRI